MSDFDEVLERLVIDPGFASALASDPGLALASYSLSDDEISILHTQVGGAGSTDHAVETRANQSSTFGLLGSLGGLLADGIGGGSAGIGHAATSGFGTSATSGFGPAGHDEASFGPYAQAEGTHGGMGGLAGFGDEIGQGLSDAAPAGTSGMGHAPAAVDGLGSAPIATAGLGAAPPPDAVSSGPPAGYHTRVDVDGDGDWDKHVLIGRDDGGVDILVDNNHDGRVDFVGHDTDADGLVNSADYDKNGDGFFEKTMYDDNGDGWMDRTVPHHS